MSLISFAIKLGFIPYILPAIMPTWRWWLGAMLTGGTLLSAFWIREASADDVLTALMGLIITISFVAGAAVRAMTLMMSARGIRLRYRIAITIAGFNIMVAMLVLPVLL